MEVSVVMVYCTLQVRYFVLRHDVMYEPSLFEQRSDMAFAPGARRRIYSRR